MPRTLHGQPISLESLQGTINAMNALGANSPFPIAPATPRRLSEFGYMFPDLQADPANLLPQDAATIANLKLLGETMSDSSPLHADGDNHSIPAAYTYLGQFIDHDITLEALSGTFGNLDDVRILSDTQVLQRIKNGRTATLDLDSVYDPPAPIRGDLMPPGSVFPAGQPVPGKDKDNDLPRSDADPNPLFDRFALIGDARNDENLVVSQLHLAFLRAHNEIVKRGQRWATARRILRQLYQWIVVQDFLRKVAGDGMVDTVLANGNRFFTPGEEHFMMPLEFSVAAYRFGHSMVRPVYRHNVNFPKATLGQLFSFTALSGEIDDPNLPTPKFPRLPQNWVIEWEGFVDPAVNATRKIDTRLAEPLFHLRREDGTEQPGIAAKLATRNLLRGYKLRMPTGQAVAGKMGETVLAAQDLRDVILGNADRTGMSAGDKDTLQNSGLDKRTPLWFYILAESELQGGTHLGPVGARIVAEVLIELVRHSEDSIFESGNDWSPLQLGDQLKQEMNPKFDLSDLLKLGGVLGVPA